jgi:hypothetical protein
VRSHGGVRLRHEVGGRSDRWAPPVGDSGRGTALSVYEERGEARRRAAGLVRPWAGRARGPPRQKEEKGEREQAAGGGF